MFKESSTVFNVYFLLHFVIMLLQKDLSKWARCAIKTNVRLREEWVEIVSVINTGLFHRDLRMDFCKGVYPNEFTQYGASSGPWMQKNRWGSNIPRIIF